MGGGVLEHLDLVVSTADDNPILHDNAADRDLLLLEGLLRLAERHAHVLFVFRVQHNATPYYVILRT